LFRKYRCMRSRYLHRMQRAKEAHRLAARKAEDRKEQVVERNMPLDKPPDRRRHKARS
jgi:hypothetical protein